MWFDYPVHRIDQVGSLKDLQLEDDKPAWEKASQRRKENAQKNRERKLNEFEIAFQNIEFDGREISASELAEALETSYFPGWEKASVRRRNCGINLKNILVKMEKHTSGERVRRSARNHDTE